MSVLAFVKMQYGHGVVGVRKQNMRKKGDIKIYSKYSDHRCWLTDSLLSPKCMGIWIAIKHSRSGNTIDFDTLQKLKIQCSSGWLVGSLLTFLGSYLFINNGHF